MSGGKSLAASLRQMVAVLEDERQALAALDMDAIVGATHHKLALCDTIDVFGDAQVDAPLDAECRALTEAARDLNEVNRRVRNLLAANVAARIDALAGRPGTYGVARAANF